MRRTAVAALGVLLVAAACSSSSGPKRPVAKPGQIVTVLRGAPGDPRALTLWVALTFDRAGTLYAADANGHRVARIPKRGEATSIVKGGTHFPEPPHLGRNVGLSAARYPNFFQGIAVDDAGTVFVASWRSPEIVAVTKSGARRWVAGTAEIGDFALASGPASRVALTVPSDLAFDAAGNLYIADGNSVAKLSRDGEVTTVAGTGKEGFSGDGGPATAADLRADAMTIDSVGNLFIGDNTRVRRVSSNGIIQTIAGTGEAGFSGDGGPALQARFEPIRGIAVDARGNIFVSTGKRVREITADGVARTVAGTGEAGFSGDGGPATEARLDDPSGLAVDGAGNLYIGDFDNRIRMVGLAPSR